MTKRLLLVRHTQVEGPYLGRLIGATDIPLSGAGQAQARALADRVALETLDLCVQPHAAVPPDRGAAGTRVAAEHRSRTA